jgi:phosphoribosyl-ATP pyrophosphohydrolase
MLRRARILEVAATEAEEAAIWYEKERPGLGREFLDEFYRTLALLTLEVVPLASTRDELGERTTMRLFLHRFPYSVVVVQQFGETLIVAVAHQSRRPDYWRERLKETE